MGGRNKYGVSDGLWSINWCTRGLSSFVVVKCIAYSDEWLYLLQYVMINDEGNDDKGILKFLRDYYN